MALFGTAGLAIVALAPLLFESPPPGLARYRPAIASVIVVALALLAVEWLVVH
ncbi:MAG: hypothetical protein ACRDKZ_01945 [Actinomycetota bacterium]